MSCKYNECILDRKRENRKLVKNIIFGGILMSVGIVGLNSLENIGIVFALGGEAFLGVGIVEFFYNKQQKGVEE